MPDLPPGAIICPQCSGTGKVWSVFYGDITCYVCGGLCYMFELGQPSPTPNNSRPIWELVIADMHARDHVGRAKYGTPLQANNGRDVLRDAYEEALDLCVYLRQAIEERDTQQE